MQVNQAAICNAKQTRQTDNESDRKCSQSETLLPCSHKPAGTGNLGNQGTYTSNGNLANMGNHRRTGNLGNTVNSAAELT